jgi:hypothetical protein
MAQTRKEHEIAATADQAKPPTPFERMIHSMARIAELEKQEAAVSTDQDNAILSAETIEEMWDADERGPLGGRDLADCELAILNIGLKYSRSNTAPDGSEIKTKFRTSDGRILYLMVDAVRTSDAGEKKTIRLPKVGETFQFNTSAPSLVEKLWWLHQHGMIDPLQGKMVECVIKAIDLGGGQAVLKLRPAPRRAQRA